MGMTEEVKIPCLHIDGTGSDTVVQKAITERDCGALRLVVFDHSEGDAAHEASLEQLRQICAEAIVPVIGAGNVKRVEDIKKLIYAGCAMAVLNFRKDSNIEMLQEVSERFGKNRIAVYVPDAEVFKQNKELIETFADLLICDDAYAEVICRLTEMGIFSCNTSLRAAQPLQTDLSLHPYFTWADMKTDTAGLVPCVVQDDATGEVLMLAYMNEESFAETCRSGRMTYWSRSRQELWKKGLTSGHLQFVRSMQIDCDNDTLLARVTQIGAACHTGNRTCFYRSLVDPVSEKKQMASVLNDVYQVILDRQQHPKEGSYTNYLFDKGIDKILKKLGEEATEIIIASKNPEKQETVYEMSDFLYHMMVLMAEKGITWDDLARELANR